jgi:hypothetical protein
MSHEDKWDYEKGAMLPERKSAEQLFCRRKEAFSINIMLSVGKVTSQSQSHTCPLKDR